MRKSLNVTSLGMAAFLAADAFRWEGGPNLPVADRAIAAERSILWSYHYVASAAYKPLPFTVGEFQDASRAAIECFAQMHVSGPPMRRAV